MFGFAGGRNVISPRGQRRSLDLCVWYRRRYGSQAFSHTNLATSLSSDSSISLRRVPMSHTRTSDAKMRRMLPITHLTFRSPVHSNLSSFPLHRRDRTVCILLELTSGPTASSRHHYIQPRVCASTRECDTRTCCPSAQSSSSLFLRFDPRNCLPSSPSPSARRFRDINIALVAAAKACADLSRLLLAVRRSATMTAGVPKHLVPRCDVLALKLHPTADDFVDVVNTDPFYGEV